MNVPSSASEINMSVRHFCVYCFFYIDHKCQEVESKLHFFFFLSTLFAILLRLQFIFIKLYLQYYHESWDITGSHCYRFYGEAIGRSAKENRTSGKRYWPVAVTSFLSL